MEHQVCYLGHRNKTIFLSAYAMPLSFYSFPPNRLFMLNISHSTTMSLFLPLPPLSPYLTHQQCLSFSLYLLSRHTSLTNNISLSPSTSSLAIPHSPTMSLFLPLPPLSPYLTHQQRQKRKIIMKTKYCMKKHINAKIPPAQKS